MKKPYKYEVNYSSYEGEELEKVKEKMKERGLYYPDNSFKTRQEIRRDLALKGEIPIFETPLPVERNLEYWSSRFSRRQKEWLETSPIKENHVTISFKDDILLNLIGDIHLGNPWTDHERLNQEIEVIRNTPNSFLLFGGDLVDGFFFNPAQYEQVEQADEQYSYVRTLVKTLGKERKLLVAFSGDHDAWPRKMGIDPWAEFSKEAGIYYMQGVGHITLKIGDVEYYITAAHQLPGSSIYTNAHPGVRASKEIQGADIYVNFHTHRKGLVAQPVKMFGDKSRWIHAISAGPYKSTDEYLRKRGYGRQVTDELYGSAIILPTDKKKPQYFEDILEANRVFVNK